jgi:xanthine dehydrogenase accessory factor
MKDIYLALFELVREGRFSVLATIIQQAGPSPRGIGAKCLIRDDGSLVGTVGGGILEAQVQDRAKKVLDTHMPERLYFSLTGSDVAGTDMLCGGEVQVFLEPVSPLDPNQLAVIPEVIKILKQEGAGLIATLIDQTRWQGDQAPKVLLETTGKITGVMPGFHAFDETLLDNDRHIFRSRHPFMLPIQDDSGSLVEVFLEPVSSRPILYLFGGGHVSAQIVPLASRVGFEVVVIDDRPEFTDPGLFPGARDVHQLPFEGVMKGLPVDGSSYLVIVTRGHLNDKEVLAQALETNAGYIGMIGSRRKRDMIYESLIEQGFTREDLSRVHSPIGLDIGAETPEEIAVSITAELILERSRHTAR